MMNTNLIKKLTLFLTFNFLLITLFAQTPNAIKYQTVVRDGAGVVLNNQNVDFQISIIETSASGSAVYVETFSATTNQFGLVNLEIGTGTVGSGIFSTINWAGDLHFVKVEVDINDGNGMQNMGTSQLLSVPYALNAESAENVFSGNYTDLTNQPVIPTQTSDLINNSGFITSPNDADSDTTNEIQDLQLTGNTLKITNNTSATNIDLSSYSNIWQENSNDIYYNGGNVGVGVNNPDGKLIVKADAGMHKDTAIFEVKNKNGKTIFAVYEQGVRIYVDDSGTKANSSKAGFAVGGFNATKALTNEYFRVTPDSIRAYIESNSGSEKAGFAVGGFNATKTTPDILFNIGASDSTDVIDSVARIAWYPQKEAFMAGRVVVQSTDSVGRNSFATGHVSKAMGDYSQAFGYRARANGHYSTAIGNYANAVDSGSYAIGSGATAIGLRSFALGSTGVDSIGNATSQTKATGDFSYAFGMGSNASNIGAFSFGTQNNASGEFSLAMGYKTNTIGNYSTAMGKNTVASGSVSTAMGIGTIASGSVSTAMGIGTIASGGFSTALGNGTSASAENSIAMGEGTHASGNYSTAMGSATEASGNYSTAMGSQTEASGNSSTALGNYSEATGAYSIAMGNHTKSNGSSSTAMGAQTKANGDYSTTLGGFTKANGDYSVAMGYYSIANEEYSTAIGYFAKARGARTTAIGDRTIAKAYMATVVGTYNDTTASTNQTSWVDTDPIFIVGNGNTSRHNAMTILKNGYVGIGTTTPNYRLQVTGSVVPENDKVYDLGKPSLAWDDVYYDDLHNQGAAAFIDRNITEEILLYPPKGKTEGMVDYKTERGLIELDPNSLPKALTGGTFWILTDEMTTYNYKANYEQQLQIKMLKEKNIIQEQSMVELKQENKQQQKMINELLKRIEKLENK